MTKGTAALSQHALLDGGDKSEAGKHNLREFIAQLNGPSVKISETGLSWGEQELLREAILSVPAIRFGSISLVIHEGHLVEVSKTVRIRNSSSSPAEKRATKGKHITPVSG